MMNTVNDLPITKKYTYKNTLIKISRNVNLHANVKYREKQTDLFTYVQSYS